MGTNDWTDAAEQRYLLKQYRARKFPFVCQQFCPSGLHRETLSDGRVRVYMCCYQKIAATEADVPATIEYLAGLVADQVQLGRVTCQQPPVHHPP